MPIAKTCINALAGAVLLLMALSGCGIAPPAQAPGTMAGPAADAGAQAEFQAALDALKAGQSDMALTLLQRLAEHQPQWSGVQVNIGIIHLQAGRHQQALTALQQAVRLNPQNAAAHHHLGIAHRQLGRFQEAQRAYTEALKLNPDYANAHLNMGILLDLYLQRPGQALLYYEHYQKLNGSENPQVAKWILDLQQRLKSQQAGQAGG